MHRIGAAKSESTCIVCGAPVRSERFAPVSVLPPVPVLSPVQALSPVCDLARCQLVALDRFRGEQAALRRRTLRAQVEGPGDVVFTPVNGRRTVPLSASRRRAFARHVETVVGAAFAGEHASAQQVPSGPSVPGTNVHLPPETPSAVHQAIAAACANCRGWCCLTGSTTAWITSDTVRRVMGTHPALNAEELAARYLSQLPPRTYASSCVYHSATGCALEPAMRSDTCHTFLCDGVFELVQLVRAPIPPAGSPTPPAVRNVHIAATEGSQVVRVTRLAGS